MLNKRKLVVVTGANGFIGNALVKELCLRGYTVRATVRSENAFNTMEVFRKNAHLKTLTNYMVGDLTKHIDWQPILKNADTVIHCAALAHNLKVTKSTYPEITRQVNYLGTNDLAKEASIAGVRRFIFISSIGVLGTSSHSTPFSEDSLPTPEYHYAQVKLDSEQALSQLITTMEIVVVRPPLVYGPGVKGNFEKLLHLIAKNWLLPLGGIKNKRQFIGIDNLVDFILTCIEAPKAANQIFVVADNDTVSTSQLVREISIAMGNKPRLFPIPQQLTNWCLKKLGKSRLADQILNNLEIDTTKSKNLIGWIPPYTLSEQLKLTIIWHQEIQGKKYHGNEQK